MLQSLWKILSATWRKPQTFREMTFAMRGNAKPKVLILQHDG